MSPSTPHWVEYNTASTDSHGSRTDSDWKSVNDSTTAWSGAPVTAGNASYQKIQALAFDSGAWNNLTTLTFKIDSNTYNDNSGAANLSVYGTTISGWTTPVSTTADNTLLSTAGIAANFCSPTPWAAGTSSVASVSTNSVITQALRSQVRTASTSAPGDSQSARTLTASWTES
jgi:hypothetical protein